MKKILINIIYGIGIGMRALPYLLGMGLMYAIKFVFGILMCLAYPFEFAHLKLTQKEQNWGKSMYIPNGLRFAIAKIEF